MKRSIKALGVCLLAGAAAVTVTGCGKVNKDYDVYFFNQKSEIADSLNDLADEYEAQTGKKVKVFFQRDFLRRMEIRRICGRSR